MNNLDRDVRQLLRDRDDEGALSQSALGARLRESFGTHTSRQAIDLAMLQTFAVGGLEARILVAEDRCGLADRTYYRRRKEALERLSRVIVARLRKAERWSPAAIGRNVLPIALPMVDRLEPERIEPGHYFGTDRGRALSAAALAAEMSGEGARADALLEQAADNVYDCFGARDPASVFEVAQNALYVARCRGDLAAMRSAVRSMASVCARLSLSARMKFTLDCGELYLYEGRLRDARAELDLVFSLGACREDRLLWSIAYVRKAQIALATRNLKEAEKTGKLASELASAHADVRVYASEVLGRCALQTGATWSPEGLDDCRSAFHALSMKSIAGRYLLERGAYEQAWEIAKAAYERARALKYYNLASRSAATLGACLLAAAPLDRGPWSMEALRLYLAPIDRNAYAADDLFHFPVQASKTIGPFVLEERFAHSLAGLYLERFGDSAFDGVSRSLLACIILCILRNTHGVRSGGYAALRRASYKAWQHDAIAIQRLDRDMRRLCRFLQALAVLWPVERRSEIIHATRREARRAQHVLHQSMARCRWQSLAG